MWQALLVAALSEIIKIVGEKLKEWLERKFAAITPRLPAMTGDKAADTRIALEAVYDTLYWWEPRRKRFVSSLMIAIPAAVAGKAPTAWQIDEIQTAALAV